MLIIDMPMPKRCFDCPMHDWTYGQHETRQNLLVCNARHELEPILSREIPNGDERPEWCPIKGVLPDEHGDLVDKETAKNAFDSSFLTFRMKEGETMRGFYQRTIDELPVLIKAERKDDEKTVD